MKASEFYTEISNLTPAETLRRAAGVLRTAIGPLGDCRGPWSVSANRGYPQEVTNVGVPLDVCQTYDMGGEPVTARYIATMHPGVAFALIGVLEAWALVAEVGGDLAARVGGTESLAVARQVIEAEYWARWPKESE